MRTSHLVVSAVLLTALACGKKEDPSGKTAASPSSPASAPAPSTAPAAATAPAASTGASPAAVPAGAPPADGKYERVQVEGTTVPMIQVMNGGAVVLVDTDGAKPRTWEEQYKRKRADLLPGQYDLHKTNTNKNDSFEDDKIDKEGLWVIDAKGNITKH
ncbi:MAG: hypothetical protein JST00_44585 [Deltaproteobacteria bacterium]|nr:hypothetical protein [Deltaproteobacteria bacterium]